MFEFYFYKVLFFSNLLISFLFLSALMDIDKSYILGENKTSHQHFQTRLNQFLILLEIVILYDALVLIIQGMSVKRLHLEGHVQGF